MIQENELRLGNLVQHKSITYTVLEIGGDGWLQIDNDQLNTSAKDCVGIPITEIELEKFGFKCVGLNGHRFVLHGVKINWCGETNDFAIETDGEYFFPMFGHAFVCFHEIKYLHELQNLFFALTGIELKTNL